MNSHDPRDQFIVDKWDSENARRYNTRVGIEKILADAEERDRRMRTLDMRIRYDAIKGHRIA